MTHCGSDRDNIPDPPVVHAPGHDRSTPEQNLNQLDKLAAGGYITPVEHKARGQAILDTM